MTAPAGAAQAAAVVSPASTTGSQDVKADSSTAPSTANRAAEPKAPAKTLKERAKELFGMSAKAEQPQAEKNQAGDAEVQAEKQKDKPEGNETIPMAAFKERLHRESEKTKTARSDLHAAQLESKRQSAALEIALTEVKRLTEALQSGAKLDPRDEEIRAMRLANAARSKAQELQAAHAGEVDAADQAEAHTEVVRQVGEEVAAAVKAHPLIDRAELIRECKRADNIGRPIHEVAAEVEARKVDLVRQRIASEKPPAPSTARASGGGQGGHRFENNARGMAARLALLRQTGH
jgi:hypothetical protein